MLDITGSVSNWVMKCEPLTVSSIRLPHVADICLEVAILEFVLPKVSCITHRTASGGGSKNVLDWYGDDHR